MSKKAWIITGLIVASGAVIAGGYAYLSVQISKLKDYCYKVKSFVLKGINKNGIAFTINVLLENKSKIDAVINSYKFDVLINDLKVANVHNETKQVYKPEGVSEIKIDIDFKPDLKQPQIVSKLITISAAYLGDRSKIIVKLDGSINISHRFLKKDVPIAMQWTLAELITPSETKQNCTYLK